MSTQPQTPDSLDALLAAQPIQPRHDFTRVTLERIRAEASQPDPLDALIDDCLSKQTLDPSAGFAGRVQRTLRAKEDSDRKILGFPSWVAALGGIAALFVAGVIAFGSMIRLATDHQRQAQAHPATGEAQIAMLSTERAPGIHGLAASTGAEAVNGAPDFPELEELLMMEAAFRDVATITDNHGWQTLALLSH